MHDRERSVEPGQRESVWDTSAWLFITKTRARGLHLGSDRAMKLYSTRSVVLGLEAAIPGPQ
jgi:hypothetical protein